MYDKNCKVAVIFIGIPASGKSSYYKKYFNGFEHINLDTLHTRNKEQRILEQCIMDEKSFVVDNTNPTKGDRQRYIIMAKENGYEVVGYFFQSILKDCIERNNQRVGKEKIYPKAIAAISNKLEIPDLDEGYQHIYFVKIEDSSFITEKWRSE